MPYYDSDHTLMLSRLYWRNLDPKLVKAEGDHRHRRLRKTHSLNQICMKL